MKILLPFVDLYDNNINHPMITGGAELFCRHLNNHFDVTVQQIPIGALKYSIRERNRISLDIIEEANEINADIIVSNFSGSIFSGAKLLESNIPIMIIEHCMYPMRSIYGRWNNADKKGHSVCFVSKSQRNRYKVTAKRLSQRLPSAQHYINPSFCEGEKPEIQDIEYDCVTIGRCYSGKFPFKLHDFIKGTDLNGLVITSKTDYDDDAYYEKNKNRDNTIWNQPYDVVMNTLGKSKTYFSTCVYETWGISSLESLAHGVPIILNCDKTGSHASENISASSRHFKKIKNNDKNALVDAIKSFDVNRKEVQDMTWEKHSLESWKNNFIEIASMTIDKFKTKHKRIT